MDPVLTELYANRDFHRRLAVRFRDNPEIREAQERHAKMYTEKIEARIQSNLQARLASQI